jgi:DNA-binding XRE family transcriptional regulator
MSEAGLPVNQSGPGLTLVHGWSSEERRTQGTPATIVGIDFSTAAGRLLSVEYCPFCGGKIASSPPRVRSHTGPPAPAHAPAAAHEPPHPPAAEAHATTMGVASSRAPSSREAAPPEPRPSARTAPEPAPSSPIAAAAPALKALREKLGLSQAELGEKLGLARSSIANYENGRAPLSQRLRKWMAKHEKKLEERT